jgi:seryl-tRNA synthetase
MLDRKFVRAHHDEVAAMLKARNTRVDLDELKQLDDERRRLIAEVETLRHDQKKASGEIARIKREKGDASEILKEMGQISQRVKGIDPQLKEIDEKYDDLLLAVPNMFSEQTPVGASEDDNVVHSTWGEPRKFDFTPKDHVEIGEALGILDMGRAAKISGARFAMQRGAGALMERALINFMLDTQTQTNGYTEIAPPYMVNSACLRGTGQLPKFAEDLFKVEGRDLWLIPTAEVPLTNIHHDEILEAEDLPINYCAYTPCFRSEAGSHGKDTRGMIRVHQFDKVELVKFTHPDESENEHAKLMADAEMILRALNLPYRVVELCSADLGFSAKRCFDLEVWLPSQNRYREISSCSNFGDFQARRAKIRFRKKGEKGTQYVHTINGSGLAAGRTFVAILENYQNEDGSVTLPTALKPYMHGLDNILTN